MGILTQECVKKIRHVLFFEFLAVRFKFSNAINFLQFLWFLLKSNFFYVATSIEILYETTEKV